jgi:hypothetical protein
MRFYNRSASDAEYVISVADAWYTICIDLPGGPNYVTNSLMLGTNFDTGTGAGLPVPMCRAWCRNRLL